MLKLHPHFHLRNNALVMQERLNQYLKNLLTTFFRDLSHEKRLAFLEYVGMRLKDHPAELEAFRAKWKAEFEAQLVIDLKKARVTAEQLQPFVEGNPLMASLQEALSQAG